MGIKNIKKVKKEVLRLLASRRKTKTYNTKFLVKHVFRKRNKLLRVVKNHKTPFYIYDKEELEKSIREFKTAFENKIPRVKIFYAMKANPHQLLLQDVIKNGLGIDASSGLELEGALEAGSKDILFTGPAKTKEELGLALRNSQKVILNIDSFIELRKLESMVKSRNALRVGVRISPFADSKWAKFGVPIRDLIKIWDRLKKNKSLAPLGIQIHTSWNEDAEMYKKIIHKIADFLKRSPWMKQELKFIDLGGGFLSYGTEGLHSWSLLEGKIAQVIRDEVGTEFEFTNNHFESPALKLQSYAKEIGDEIKKRLSDLNCTYYFEPGRIICNNAMHIMLRIEDMKSENIVITDGGTNMIGWERFEEEYCPVLNLSRPSQKEKKTTIFGSLCTPHDIWGYYYYGKDIKEGDILVIPYQGAYTYTYAQQFIKPFPRVYTL